MKILLPTILILTLAFCVFGQTKTTEDIKTATKALKKNRQYKVNYDKFTDKSSVVFFGSMLGGSMSYAVSGTMIELCSGFGFDGNTLKNTVNNFDLIFTAKGKDWTFLKNQHLYAIADDQRFDLGEGDISSDIKQTILSGYQTDEILVFKINREDLEKLANAKKLEIKVGGREFTIKDDDKQAFLNMLILGKA